MWFDSLIPSRTLIVIGSIHIFWYGVLVVGGIIAAYFVIRKVYMQTHTSDARLVDSVFYVVLGGLIGARFWHVFIFQWEYYAEHISEIFKIWEGGIAIQGAIIGAAIALYVYTKLKKQSFFKLVDFLNFSRKHRYS